MTVLEKRTTALEPRGGSRRYAPNDEYHAMARSSLDDVPGGRNRDRRTCEIDYFRFLLNNGFAIAAKAANPAQKGANIMAKYLYAYHGGSVPQSKEEGERVMQAWMGWFGQLGASVVDGGNPVGQSTTVKNGSVTGNGGANPVSGYSIIEATSTDDAVAKAKGCPIIAAGGSVEIAEILPM